MPVMIVDHHLKDLDSWFALCKENPPSQIGSWRLLRGVDDPNRVYVIGEVDAFDVDAVNSFFGSEQMQPVLAQANKMSTAPIEIVWPKDSPH